MFVTGPNVIKKVTGEEVSFEDLGSAKIHSHKSGVCHIVSATEKECIASIKKLLSYLPSNYMDLPPKKQSFAALKVPKVAGIVPENLEKTFDMKRLINAIFDPQSFFEVHKDFAENAIVGFARLGGHPVGIITTQPMKRAGCLDISSSEKISRFINLCDAFNIPIISLVDVPGYLPGVQQEQGGIIKHGAKILYSISNSTVPKIALIIRKAFGGAYIAFTSHKLGFDAVAAWPTAVVGVVGAEEAVEILFKKEQLTEQEKKDKVQEYKGRYYNPYIAAKTGAVDVVIEPKDSRKHLIATLESIMNKRKLVSPKKHTNFPI